MIVPSEVLAASLGGVDLALRKEDPPIRWKLSFGTKPYILPLEMSRERIEQILEVAESQFPDGRTVERGDPIGPLTLRASEPGYPDFECKGLYVSQAGPTSDNVNLEAILVTDLRVLFKRTVVERAYNMPRGGGATRYLSTDEVPVQVGQASQDRIYRATSLVNGEDKWTAVEVLKDILAEVVGPDKFVFDKPDNFEGEGEEAILFQDDVEGFILHKVNGQQAVDLVLGLLPGTQIYPGLDGKIHVAQSYGSGGEDMATRAGTPHGGGWSLVDRAYLRPRRVRVYFEQEAELRFDFSTTGGFSRERGREDLACENVLQSPDPSLTLVDGTEVAQGTWITVDEAFAAWNADPTNPPPIPQLFISDKVIRRLYMEGLGTLHMLFSATTTGGISSIWTARIHAIEEHWRRSFRILPAWIDKIRRLLPIRAAIIDQENGIRAAAQSWFNYAIKPSISGLANGPANDEQGWHVTDCYAADLKAASTVGPAEVRVKDADNGIFQISLRKDVFGRGSLIAPGTLLGTGFPSFSAGSVFATWSLAELDVDWSMSTVLTAVQDSPNSEKRLLAVTIEAEEAAENLGADIGQVQLGPDYEVHGSVETARYAWSDPLSDEIKAAFFDGAEWPSELLVNPDTIQAVARAQAARVYTALEDRAEGAFVARFNPELHPAGSCQQVDHVIDRNKGLRTELTLPPMIEDPGPWALLPASARATLRRLVQQ